MKQFMVIRLRFIGESEIHSTEYFDDEHTALQRFSNIWAADLNNKDVTWNGVFLFDVYNLQWIKKYELNDLREQKNTFFILARFLEKNDAMTHSIQYYFADPADPSVEYMEAVKRWFNVIAADLNDEEVTANGAVIFDSLGNVKESRFFDRPQPNSEPEDEPEEEPAEEEQTEDEGGEE